MKHDDIRTDMKRTNIKRSNIKCSDIKNKDKDDMNDSGRFTKTVQWSSKDKCYIGSCPQITNMECRGNDEKEVFQALCDVVDETIRLHRLLGKPLPMKILHTEMFSNTIQEKIQEKMQDEETRYPRWSTLKSNQNRFLRHCSSRAMQV